MELGNGVKIPLLFLLLFVANQQQRIRGLCQGKSNHSRGEKKYGNVKVSPKYDQVYRDILIPFTNKPCAEKRIKKEIFFVMDERHSVHPSRRMSSVSVALDEGRTRHQTRHSHI